MQAQNGRPPKPEGYTVLSFFRRCVWEALWAGKFPFADTDTVQFSWNGSSYEAKAAAHKRAGNMVFVRACLEDGTECFVEVPIGRIYRLRADTPGTTPTIDPGKVPDGSPELI